MSTATDVAQQSVAYPTLFLLVAAGAIVPVVPTGAVVSGAGVVAFHAGDPVTSSLAVFAVSCVAALLGDLVLFWLCVHGGAHWLERVRKRVDPQRLAAAHERLERHGTAIIVVSRLLPAGRIPVMVAAALAEVPVRRFAPADVVAVLAWTVCYQVIGVLGGALFPHPWQGVAIAIALVIAVATAPRLVTFLRHDRAPDSDPMH